MNPKVISYKKLTTLEGVVNYDLIGEGGLAVMPMKHFTGCGNQIEWKLKDTLVVEAEKDVASDEASLEIN